jgi:hypothetical protein
MKFITTNSPQSQFRTPELTMQYRCRNSTISTDIVLCPGKPPAAGLNTASSAKNA